MKQNPEFIGPRHDEDKRESAKEMLLKWSQESIQPIDGELEKTEEEIKIIETVNDMIGEELNSLEIEGYESIAIEKIHILEGDNFKERFPNSDNKAFFVSTSDILYLNREKIPTKAHAISVILHELIHRASTRKFYTDEENNVYDARVGYRIRSSWKDSNREQRFVGFNEGMNDQTVYKILLKNPDHLKSLGITREDIQGSIYSYMNYGPIIASIVRGIAQYKNMSQIQVFNDLEKGQFQNSTLVLKDVEKAFGKGSLEILSLLGALENKEDDEGLEKLIGQFFTETDLDSRENLKTQIKEFFEKSQAKATEEKIL